MTFYELKEFLDLKAEHYQSQEFITADPIQIPHRFSKKEDIEIAGFLIATIDGLPTFLSAILKLPFYYLLNHKRKKIYYQRVSGFLNALIGKKSYYRPKIND